jgi:hypothetical protein
MHRSVLAREPDAQLRVQDGWAEARSGDLRPEDTRQKGARREVSASDVRESSPAPASAGAPRSSRSAWMAPGFAPHPAEPEPPAGAVGADRARVERLELMMRSLMSEIADLKRSTGNTTDPSGPSGMPPVG